MTLTFQDVFFSNYVFCQNSLFSNLYEWLDGKLILSPLFLDISSVITLTVQSLFSKYVSVKIFHLVIKPDDLTEKLILSPFCSRYFISDDIDAPREDEDEEEEEEDEWPPFKKVGQFDPYSDDPRLAVKKVSFCGMTGKLVIGGTAGKTSWYKVVYFQIFFVNLLYLVTDTNDLTEKLMMIQILWNSREAGNWGSSKVGTLDGMMV